MYIQLLIIFIVFIIYCILKRQVIPGSIVYNKYRQVLATLAGLLCILQSGLRHIAVGADTYAYKLMFEQDIKLSWSEVYQNIINVYFHNEGKDAGYILFEKLMSFLSTDYQVYLILVAVIFFVPFFRFVYKNTNNLSDILYAVIIYQSLFFSFFSITGLRQTIATGFCLVAFEFIKSRKLTPFILIVIVGAFIHKSCLLFLPFYWIANYKKSIPMFYGALLSYPIMTYLSRAFVLQLAKISASDNYLGYAEQEGAGAISFSIFYVLMTLLGFVILQRNRVFLYNKRMIANAVIMGLFFLPLTFTSAALMRIVQYFSIFIVLFVPFFSTEKKLIGSNKLYLRLIILALLYKIVYGNSQYAFFWEYMKLGDNYI